MSEELHEFLKPDGLHWATLSVATGADVSEEKDLRGFALVGVLTPAALTATEAEIEVSADNINFVPIYNRAGIKLTLALAPDRHVTIEPGELPGLRKMRLKLNDNEAAARELHLLIRKLN